MYILYYYYINILIPTFNSWIILSTNNFIVSMIIFFPLSHFFPFWRKKQKPNYKHTKKKYYFTNLQNSYFKDIKNLKLNGATILDLSKKQKPETLIVVVKKINDGLLQIYLFMYDICPTHKQKKKNMKRKFSNS